MKLTSSLYISTHQIRSIVSILGNNTVQSCTIFTFESWIDVSIPIIRSSKMLQSCFVVHSVRSSVLRFNFLLSTFLSISSREREFLPIRISKCSRFSTPPTNSQACDTSTVCRNQWLQRMTEYEKKRYHEHSSTCAPTIFSSLA